ncbi:hypothetical protein J7K76_02635 [Candidatus Bipolaricaulota bacterium]|nr:hypothetical protein [Candidatus Bipolaricaulota bacterium]
MREYLRVLWRGKWIVLLCTLLAVGVAAPVSFRSPDIYRVDARLSVVGISIPGITEAASPSSESGVAEFALTPVSAPEVVEWCRDREVIERAVTLSGVEVPPAWVDGHLSAKASKTFVDLALEGPLSAAELVRLLEGIIKSLEDRNKEAVRDALSTLAADLEARSKALGARKATWEKELSRIKDRAESQRKAILARIETLVDTDAPIGKTATGYRVQKELDLLYERLSHVESFLDELDRLGIGALPGAAAEYVQVEGELAELSVQKAVLDALLENPPTTLQVLRGPQAPADPVGPNRTMNIAVAGVLGIFVGILGAFAWNYLREGGDGRHT